MIFVVNFTEKINMNQGRILEMKRILESAEPHEIDDLLDYCKTLRK